MLSPSRHDGHSLAPRHIITPFQLGRASSG